MSGYPAGRVEDLQERTIRIVRAGASEVGVLKIKGVIKAYENRCPHQGGPACAGDLLGRLEAVVNEQQQVIGERFSEERFHIICPWHGWSYDVMTGACVADPRLRLIPWEFEERNGILYLLGPARKK